MPAFTADSPFHEEHPHALALYCSDGRYTRPVEDLLAALGHERLDTLTLPGGPGLLNWLQNSFVDHDAADRAAGFLIRGHGIQEVVLVAHHGCGYYRAKHPNATPDEILAAQVRDLRAAAAHLIDRHPTIKARLFYALPADGKVRFREVPLVPRVKSEPDA